MAASGVETITNVTSAAAQHSAAVSASVAPASTRGWHAAAVRFHTVSLCPAFIRFSAMGTPMMPAPMKPTLVGDTGAEASAMVTTQRVERERTTEGRGVTAEEGRLERDRWARGA